MKPVTLSKVLTATVVICFVATAVLWVANAHRVILGQGGTYPEYWNPNEWYLSETPADWTMAFAPQPYFLALYALEACAILGALWFRVRGWKKPLSDYVLVFAVAAGALALALVLLFHRPAMPAGWSKLRAGMTQEEVESLVGWEAVLREEDEVVQEHEAPMLGTGGVWVLELHYDGNVLHSVRHGDGRYGNARLTGARAAYGHRCRLLCSPWRELL
jgi:hypothetical protein